MTTSAPEKKVVKCGIVMPISAIDGCSVEHWNDVRNIIEDSVKSIENWKVDVRLVSDADEVGVIQKRIIHNLYFDDIVVCDVSGKNPNVMFELGMRLAFDKATIIIKDDHTNYSFDTGVIEHLSYPRDLRFNSITNFKLQLASKLEATLSSAQAGGSIFLRNFGTFTPADALQGEVKQTQFDALFSLLGDVRQDVSILRRMISVPTSEVTPNRFPIPNYREITGTSARSSRIFDVDKLERDLQNMIKDIATRKSSMTESEFRDTLSKSFDVGKITPETTRMLFETYKKYSVKADKSKGD